MAEGVSGRRTIEAFQAAIHVGGSRKDNTYRLSTWLKGTSCAFAILRHHGVKLPKVRTALDYVKHHFRIERPLIDQAFQTDGLDLFIEHCDILINAFTQAGQEAMKRELSVCDLQANRDGIRRAFRLSFTLSLATRRSDAAPSV